MYSELSDIIRNTERDSNEQTSSGSVAVCHLHVFCTINHICGCDRGSALIGCLALAPNNRNSCGDIKLPVIQTLSKDGVLSLLPLGGSLGSSGWSLIAVMVSITLAFSSPNQNNYKAAHTALVTPQRLCVQGWLLGEVSVTMPWVSSCCRQTNGNEHKDHNGTTRSVLCNCMTRHACQSLKILSVRVTPTHFCCHNIQCKTNNHSEQATAPVQGLVITNVNSDYHWFLEQSFFDHRV